jgi:hypothetical protein
MKISARLAVILAVIFAAICLAFAFTGFASLGGIADPEQAANARGYAWFWVFLALVAVAFGLLSWWIERTQSKDPNA